VSRRLPTHVEVASILRRVAAAGDFATVMRKGDPERGSLLIFVGSRGRHLAILERVLGMDGEYRWQATRSDDSTGSTGIDDFLARRARFDDDLWAIELDIADAERFIAETTSLG
jgi:hypothetical protein